jgi:hypothetical protein
MAAWANLRAHALGDCLSLNGCMSTLTADCSCHCRAQLAGVACTANANATSHTVALSAALVMPATSLLVTPLYAKRLAAAPLSREVCAATGPWQVRRYAASP